MGRRLLSSSSRRLLNTLTWSVSGRGEWWQCQLQARVDQAILLAGYEALLDSVSGIWSIPYVHCVWKWRISMCRSIVPAVACVLAVSLFGSRINGRSRHTTLLTRPFSRIRSTGEMGNDLSCWRAPMFCIYLQMFCSEIPVLWKAKLAKCAVAVPCLWSLSSIVFLHVMETSLTMHVVLLFVCRRPENLRVGWHKKAKSYNVCYP